MTGTLRWNRQRGQYQIDIRIGGRRVRRLVGKNKDLAESVLARYLDERIRVRHGLPSWAGKRTTTLERYAPRYLETVRATRSERTYLLRKAALRLHLLPAFGGRRLAEIRQSEIQGYVRFRSSAGAAAATIHLEIAALRHLLRAAAEEGLIPEAPKTGPLPRVARRERFLTEEEVARLLVAVRPDAALERFVALALWTGLGSAEILGLRWSDYDPERLLIVTQRRKTSRALRIPVSPALAAVLCSPGRPTEPIVPSTGRHTAKSIRRRLERRARGAGIEGCSPHVLRHTFTSWLWMSGADGASIRDLLGHRSLSTTDIYTHTVPDRLRRSIERLPWARGGQHLRPVDE